MSRRFFSRSVAAPAYEIFCDGTPISVGTNLWSALLALIFVLTYTLLSENDESTIPSWAHNVCAGPPVCVDALCINQSNLQDRSAQVMLMNRIYGQAKHIKIWLGGQDAFSRSALETIQILNTNLN